MRELHLPAPSAARESCGLFINSVMLIRNFDLVIE